MANTLLYNSSNGMLKHAHTSTTLLSITARSSKHLNFLDNTLHHKVSNSESQISVTEKHFCHLFPQNIVALDTVSYVMVVKH